MRLFLDSSVLLAASGSATGASRLLIETAADLKWELVSSLYCAEETWKNLPKLGKNAVDDFLQIIAPRVYFHETALVLDRPMVYKIAKDRPVVITAFALESYALLTLDRADFQQLLGSQFYGLWIMTPGDWIRKAREESSRN